MNDIEDILIKIGFDLKNENCNYWRAIPIYRESSNASSLRISKATGSFIDFAANIRGNLNDLVKISLGLNSIEEAKKWIAQTGYKKEYKEKKPKIVLDKKIDLKYIDGLMPHYSFYEEEPRNISRATLEKFECGICFSGKQNNRFLFVIRDEDKKPIGICGRDLIGGRVKWKLMGDKRKWIYPLNSIEFIEKEKSVFLVESVGDMLALYDIGVKNVLVLFGIDISTRLINYLATLNLNNIYISTNNDSEKEENWGKLAAIAIKNRLSKLIDESKISIVLPPAGDWGEFKKEDRIKYVEKIQNNWV